MSSSAQSAFECTSMNISHILSIESGLGLFLSQDLYKVDSSTVETRGLVLKITRLIIITPLYWYLKTSRTFEHC